MKCDFMALANFAWVKKKHTQFLLSKNRYAVRQQKLNSYKRQPQFWDTQNKQKELMMTIFKRHTIRFLSTAPQMALSLSLSVFSTRLLHLFLAIRFRIRFSLELNYSQCKYFLYKFILAVGAGFVFRIPFNWC